MFHHFTEVMFGVFGFWHSFGVYLNHIILPQKGLSNNPGKARGSHKYLTKYTYILL